MFFAHQFDTDDERGRGVFVMQNWNLWLRPFLEKYRNTRDVYKKLVIFLEKINQWNKAILEPCLV